MTPAAYQETAQPGDPAGWRTDDFNAGWGLGAMGAEHAYTRGLSGAGIALGQFDGGTDLTHPEFADCNHVALSLGDPGCVRDPGTVMFDAFFDGCFSSKGDKQSYDLTCVYPCNGQPYGYLDPSNHGTYSVRIPADPLEYGYTNCTGTSMTAPHVTGALGLLFERFPYLSAPQMRDILLTAARDLGYPGVDDIYGWGSIDLRKAIVRRCA